MIEFLTDYAVIGLVLFPFLGATFCVIFGRKAGCWIGIGSAIAMMILALGAWRGVAREGMSRYAVGGWGSPLGIDLAIDGLSAFMLIVTAWVGMGVSVYACGYFGKHSLGAEHSVHTHTTVDAFFWPVWLFTWGGLNVLFLSADIFNIYVALEIVSFSAVTLVALGGSVAAVMAALRYLFLTIAGSSIYLLGVGILYSAYGTLDMEALSQLLEPGMIAAVVVALTTVGLMIKGALVPMHFWLPPAHANAPAPVSAILSGLVVMGAFYLCMRLWLGVFATVLTPLVGHVLGVCGALAIVWGSLQALRQPRLKMLVAYSTVAQIGYFFLLFPLIGSVGSALAWNGGLYLAAAHACAKAAAFMVAGSIIFATGDDRIDNLRGLAERFPLGVWTFALAGVSLIGLPPSGGFFGKWFLLKGTVISNQWIYMVLILGGGLMTAAYIFRVLQKAFESPLPGATRLNVPWSMQVAAMGLALTSVVMGVLVFYPLQILAAPIQAPMMVIEGVR